MSTLVLGIKEFNKYFIGDGVENGGSFGGAWGKFWGKLGGNSQLNALKIRIFV